MKGRAEDAASHIGAHAIVIGAGIAGLAATRALAERFDRVTVVDRDALPAGLAERAGVPQGRHGHGLLASGLQALARLFPGLEADLMAAGAVRGDVIGDVRWFQYGHYKARFNSGRRGLLMSRALLEGVIRERVRQLSNVVIADSCHVLGLRASPSAMRIVGVHTQPDIGEAAAADLVVDASGRASRTPT